MHIGTKKMPSCPVLSEPRAKLQSLLQLLYKAQDEGQALNPTEEAKELPG